MTFRELLTSANLNEVYLHINVKDNSYEGQEPIPLETTVLAYSKVVKELLEKKKTKSYKYKFFVDEIKDFDETYYIDVSLFNPHYIAPDPNLKPWGGKRGEKIPAGHYNCNLDKYNERFALGAVGWSKLIDTPVINNTQYSAETVLAEILWEITFYGWTEVKIENTWAEINKSFKKTEEDIKNGKYIEIPPLKEGGLKVVIPECVQKQIDDITNL